MAGIRRFLCPGRDSYPKIIFTSTLFILLVFCGGTTAAPTVSKQSDVMALTRYNTRNDMNTGQTGHKISSGTTPIPSRAESSDNIAIITERAHSNGDPVSADGKGEGRGFPDINGEQGVHTSTNKSNRLEESDSVSEANDAENIPNISKNMLALDSTPSPHARGGGDVRGTLSRHDNSVVSGSKRKINGSRIQRRRRRKADKSRRWSVDAGQKLLDNFPLGNYQYFQSCPNDTLYRNEERINDLRAIFTMCQKLQDVLLIREIVNSHQDLEPFWAVTSHLMSMLSVANQFGISHYECQLVPAQLFLEYAEEVFEGNKFHRSVMESLQTLHDMIIGRSTHLGRSPVLKIYEKRLPASLKQSKQWYVGGLLEYLTLLQAGGYAVYQASVNVLEEQVSNNATMSTFTKLAMAQEISLKKWMIRVKDFYVNPGVEPFFSFTALKETDTAVSVDTGVLGFTPKEASISSTNDGSVHQALQFVQVKGCQLSDQRDSLSLRCSVRKHPKCGTLSEAKSKGVASASNNWVEREVATQDILTPNHTRQSYESLSCVMTSWVRASKPGQTVCAVKLNVNAQTNCLGLGVYFCSIDSCDVRANQGWAFSKSSSGSALKKRKKRKASSTWDWARSNYIVDSHMTLPEFDGRVTGIRLYNKNGQLAIGLRTAFQ